MKPLRLILTLTLASTLALAQRGGGGRGGGGFGGGGFRGGGMMGGGGFRGGGMMGGGGFRGGGFGGGGFRGGFGGFRGGFNRGFNRTIVVGGFGWPGWGWGWGGWGWPGWGWGWGGWGGGWPVAGGYSGCDPYWGCPGGYIDPGYAGVAGYPQQPPVAYGQPSAPPVVLNQSFGATDAALGQPGQPVASFYRPADYYLIAFNDHTIRAALNYQWAADTLIFTARDGQTVKAPMSMIDLRFTQQLNRDRHVDFKLP